MFRVRPSEAQEPGQSPGICQLGQAALWHRFENLDDHRAGAIVRHRERSQADITMATAESAMAELLERIERVNRDQYFLARATRVTVFGSYLRPEVDRLEDVDVAVELEAKEADRQRIRQLNYRRVAEAVRRDSAF